MNEPYVELAERLNALAPGKQEKLTYFVNSGSEAVEHAIRVARYITNRDAVVKFDHAYHGRTQLSSALSAAVMPWKHGFGVSAEPIFRGPFAIRSAVPWDETLNHAVSHARATRLIR
jgi:4-aminobutyrate aminotransferase/(S)-3-amino-2-methylpropionate transaminase